MRPLGHPSFSEHTFLFNSPLSLHTPIVLCLLIASGCALDEYLTFEETAKLFGKVFSLLLLLHCVLVSYGCRNKLSQTSCVKQHTFINIQFWRPEVQHQA